MRGPKDTGKEKPPNAPTQHPTGAAQAPDHPANEEERLPAVDDEEQESGKFSQDSIVEETQQSSQASNTDVEESEKEGQEASEGGRTQPVVRGTEAGAIPLTQRDTSHSPQEEKCQERREADAHASVETSTGPSDVEPFEMFEAVVAEMQSAPMEQPRAAWIATIGELYSTVHAKVKVDEDLIPGSKRRYPKLKSEEKILLFKLFKAIYVEANGTFEEWERYAQAATQDLYNTNWSFKNIMHSMISKVEWATTQPLNQWAEKVTGGAQTQSARANRTEATSSYQDFMFNPSKFSKEDIGVDTWSNTTYSCGLYHMPARRSPSPGNWLP
ncbi:hypothetical protein PR001_g24201 [Phytophthora rubi]|uniref:Uncharacterized protein n=1 Tax=Phytophthora rubi TaxID=129364 RepID=A0A6A3ICI4_9STRA|nr:hypothetical protein PR002_g24555 [Phytophthora rubi]KAE8980726.1 hypothetical protein PR001_g24201 [Phytophthora rubi]